MVSTVAVDHSQFAGPAYRALDGPTPVNAAVTCAQITILEVTIRRVNPRPQPTIGEQADVCRDELFPVRIPTSTSHDLFALYQSMPLTILAQQTSGTLKRHP